MKANKESRRKDFVLPDFDTYHDVPEVIKSIDRNNSKVVDETKPNTPEVPNRVKKPKIHSIKELREGMRVYNEEFGTGTIISFFDHPKDPAIKIQFQHEEIFLLKRIKFIILD